MINQQIKRIVVVVMVIFLNTNIISASDVLRPQDSKNKQKNSNYIDLELAKDKGLEVKKEDKVYLNRISYTLLKGVYMTNEPDKSKDKEVGAYKGKKLYVSKDKSRAVKKVKNDLGEEIDISSSRFFVKNNITKRVGYVDGAMLLEVNEGEDYKEVISNHQVILRKYYTSTKMLLIEIKPGADLLLEFSKLRSDERVKRVLLNVNDNRIALY